MTLLVLAVACAASWEVTGCPACNIHNYLAESIDRSSDVVVGKVVSRIDDDNATVEVIRTLRGTSKPGQRMDFRTWGQPEDNGGTFIFSNPQMSGLDFPTLSIETEEEVRFLIRLSDAQKPPPPPSWLARLFGRSAPAAPANPLDLCKPASDAEAIQRLKSWSNESAEVGFNYLFAAQPFPARKIIDAIEPIKTAYLASSPDAPPALGTDTLGNLLEALLMHDNKEAEAYITSQVRTYLAPPERSASDIAEKLHPWITPGAEWLTELLGITGSSWTHREFSERNPHHNAHARLHTEVMQVMLDALPTLSDRRLMEVVYALYETKTRTALELAALLKPGQSKDSMARGIYWSASHRSHPWFGFKGSAQPRVDLEWMLTLPLQAEFHDQISKQFESVRKL